MINANMPQLWKEDIKKSVDLYNNWFMKFAPQAYRDARIRTIEKVQKGLDYLDNLESITPDKIVKMPTIVAVLRMCTCPPIARDRLTGLGQIRQSLVKTLEDGKIPKLMDKKELNGNLISICDTISKLLDRDIITWIGSGKGPSKGEKYRASTVIADRLCGAVADPIVRNAQEQRQLRLIGEYLDGKGYKYNSNSVAFENMENGTYSFRLNIPIFLGKSKIKIPIDVVIKRKNSKKEEFPILIECKSAGDFTNTNKRRKEEAVKIQQLRTTYGENVSLILFLCGYFNSGYLGYEAAEGLDWIWEHRISDLEKLGI